MTLQETDTYTYDFWRYPPKNDFAKMDNKQKTSHGEEDFVDEAVMLIGGKFCKTVTCNITQDRTSYWDDKNDTLEERRLVGHDHTVGKECVLIKIFVHFMYITTCNEEPSID